MNTNKYEGYLTAQSPIHHGGDEKTGAETLLNRNTYIIGGKRIEIPLISGNAIRGILRRLIMADYLNQLQYQLDSKKIYHFLFDGGILEDVGTKDQGTIDLVLKDKIRKNIPPISLLGSSLGNQIFTGKLDCMKAIPICRELGDFLPDDLLIKPENSIYDFLDWDFGTRMDSLRDTREDDEQATQMLYNFETFAPGTVFYHFFILRDANKVEEGCFARMLNLWKENPWIGGKSAVGYGQLKINYDYNPEDEQEYMKYLKDNKEEIKGQLDELVEKWR